MPLPEIVAKTATEGLVSWPEHGRPRSLELDHASRPALATLVERNLAMRLPRTITAEQCDQDGRFPTERYQELVWGGEPAGNRGGPGLHELEGGIRMGWATMESRAALFALPRVGTRIQSFGATVEIARKTMIHHNWVFDLDSAELLCTSSVVNLAFDTGARRSLEIPDEMRARMLAECHEDLR